MSDCMKGMSCLCSLHRHQEIKVLSWPAQSWLESTTCAGSWNLICCQEFLEKPFSASTFNSSSLRDQIKPLKSPLFYDHDAKLMIYFSN